MGIVYSMRFSFIQTLFIEILAYQNNLKQVYNSALSVPQLCVCVCVCVCVGGGGGGVGGVGMAGEFLYHQNPHVIP